MARHLLIAFALLGTLVPASSSGEQVPAEDMAAIDAALLERVTFTPTRINSLALRAVFDATFYDVKMEIAESGGPTLTTRLARHGDEFVDIETTSTGIPMPKLTSLIKDDFALMADDDGEVFQEALGQIFPVRSRKDTAAQAVRRDGRTWTFVQGEFFKKLKGFIVTTDAEGTITDVQYSLEIEQ
jgi:hypothetical protein